MVNIQGLLEKYKQIPEERFFKELFEKEEYKPVFDRKLDVIIDVGALAGEFSAYVYEKAGIIYAIEAGVNEYQELLTNIKDFQMDNIIPSWFALSDKNEIVEFKAEGKRGGYAIADNFTGRTTRVQAITLNSFFERMNIDHVDVLKIDIEGDEARVFQAPDIDQALTKIDFIIGEHLSGYISTFEKFGFSYKRINDNPNLVLYK